jgi:hypothetical protein
VTKIKRNNLRNQRQKNKGQRTNQKRRKTPSFFVLWWPALLAWAVPLVLSLVCASYTGLALLACAWARKN